MFLRAPITNAFLPSKENSDSDIKFLVLFSQSKIFFKNYQQHEQDIRFVGKISLELEDLDFDGERSKESSK
tara:strand:+ start:295 stop:507 length:213 start_codon:yes stop_codon:yes gene_type:complete